MSLDIYFCFCCLSTNELTSLCGPNSKNYGQMLKELCLVKLSPDPSEYDCYICLECTTKIEDAVAFKKQVIETIDVLKVNGLIKITKINGNILQVEKVTEGSIEDDQKEIEDKYVISESETKYAVKTERSYYDDKEIKKETHDQTQNKMATGDIILKNEKRITVLRKRKRDAVISKSVDLKYDVPKDLKCTVCGVIMMNVKVYHAHMNGHFPNHICEVCGKGFLTEKRLKRHKPSHDKGPFSCKDCDAVFTNYNTFNSHRQRRHSSAPLYRCPHCAERFPSITRRARHLAAMHDHPDDGYKCSMCPKAFITSGNLSAHLKKTHLKTKRYKCAECSACYFQSHQLEAHLVLHTGINKYSCHFCEKSFPRKNSLNVHLKTHTGEKKYACELCSKSFTQKCTLIKHGKTHNRTKSLDANVINVIQNVVVN